MSTYAEAFPDFPAADWPTLPEGWVDISYSNDACPSVLNDALGLHLFIDYADPARRECGPKQPRFCLTLMRAWRQEAGAEVEWQLDWDGARWPDLISTEDLGEVLALVATLDRDHLDRVRMGIALADELREALPFERLVDCADGLADAADFIDDNHCTADAYEAVYGAPLVDAFGTPDEDATLGRANVATVLAARIIREGRMPAGPDLLATVRRTDICKGLAPTITRRGAFEANLALCLTEA